MKTQTIKVVVPDGCTVKYDATSQTIKFIPEDYTKITSFKTACKVLGIAPEIPAGLQNNPQLRAMYQMQVILKAVNQGHVFSLISGSVYYPYVRFIGKERVREQISRDEIQVLDFTYEGRTFTLVGGRADFGTYGGLGFFGSYDSVGCSSADFGFFACHNAEIAKYVSKNFAALIFDCCFARELGFSLCDGEKVTYNHPIQNV